MECQRRGRADSHQDQWMVADAPAQFGGRAGDVRKRQVRAEVGIVAFRVAGSVIVEAQAGDTVGRQPSGHLREEAITACVRSEEHTSELQSLMRISYAVFCLKKKKTT